MAEPETETEKQDWKEFYEKTQQDADQLTATEHSKKLDEDEFFENFRSQVTATPEKREAVIKEDMIERAKYQELDSQAEKEVVTSDNQSSKSVPLVPEYNTEDLFCDVYHQCTHLVGKDATEGFKKDVLLSYLKGVFEFDDAKCKSLIDSLKNKQVPKMVLKVDVIEAKDLSPKDANGLSDPFCTLWVSSSQTNRFTSSVKEKTLQPIWEENFKLPVNSPSQDVLHFEVWDFDAAESTKEKLTKISDVKGFRGMKKFVKEFAQTVANGNHNNELIGSAQISLKNIPATGQMAWFNLQKRGKGASKGTILLKMLFGSEKDEVVALEEHRYLVKTLLQHQMKQEGFDLMTWDGLFSPEGEMMLRQHLAQCNLGATDDLIAKWVEYMNVHQNNPMNFAILANISSMLTASIKNRILTEDEVKHFWNSARKILPSCYNNIRKIRKSAPNDKAVLVQLDAILSIIQDLSSCAVPTNFTLFPPELYGWVATIDGDLTVKSVLHEAVVHGACDWFEYLITNNRPENNSEEAKLKYLVKICQFISLDLDGAKNFHERLFKERLNFPYSKTLFTAYQLNVAELVEPVVTDMCMMMKPLDFEKRDDKDANNDPLSMGTTMFELFLTLQGIEKTGAGLFQNDDAFETFQLRKFYAWFFPGVVRWLDIAAFKALQRIDKAVELDDFVPVDSTVQYSSSAIDTMAIFHQVKTFWDQLAWPDVEGSYTFMAKIIDDICKSSVHYADRVAAKVEGSGETQNAYEKKFEVTTEWCVAINNIDYIHHSIHPFVKGLGLDKLLNSLSDFKSTTTAEHCRNTLELVMSNAVENVGEKISELSEILAKKMEPAMTRFLQEGAELLHQQCNVIDRLMTYLDENLTTLKSKLNPDNFNRILDVIWERISNILFALVQNSIEKRRPPSYFHNLHETLHILIGFFKIDEKIGKEENQKLNDILAKVERVLSVYGMETPELIHEYYMERLGEQERLEKSEDGMMTVQLSLDQDKLIIEVLNASNLRSMDSNGQSDPFVSIRLIPKHKFPTQKCKTKVHKKTLFPLFEEKFTIKLSNDQAAVKDTLVMFVMKDQDLFGATNDYMAEAFVPLNDVEKVEPNKYPKMRNLKLSRPKNTESDILKALDYRSGDKLAKDFAKKQKSRMEVPH